MLIGSLKSDFRFSVNVAVQIGDRASYSDVTRISSMLPGKEKACPFYIVGYIHFFQNFLA
jgi:hypothetical protein